MTSLSLRIEVIKVSFECYVMWNRQALLDVAFRIPQSTSAVVHGVYLFAPTFHKS